MISRGAPIGSFKWNIAFEVDNSVYTWIGETDKSKDNSPQAKMMGRFFNFETDENRPDVLNETITKDNKTIIQRVGLDIIYNGERTVKLSAKESVVSSLKEEDDIRKIHTAFSCVINSSDNGYPRYPSYFPVSKTKPMVFEDFVSLRNSNSPFVQKLYICQEQFPDEFQEIKDSYMDIFPFVEDVEIDRASMGHSDEQYEYYQYFVKIRERGIDDWIVQSDMSSGMFKSLHQIGCIYLAADGSVFLIDEFENGFGVNCIDDVTKALISCGRNIQFIITSHHPYIINNIPVSKWKIVSRKGRVVSAHDPAEFSLMKSNHESFTKLINLSIYQDGADR